MNTMERISVRIEINGSTVADFSDRRLIEASIRRRSCLPTQCELVFQAEDWSARVEPGQQLSVWLSDPSEVLFEGRIVAGEYESNGQQRRCIRLRAYDALHGLRVEQPIATFKDIGLPALARSFAEPLGLTVDIPSCQTQWRRVIQAGQTQLELLSHIARQSGYSFRLRGTRLEFYPPEGRDEVYSLRLGDSLMESRFQWNAMSASPSLHALGWDPSRLEGFHAEAQNPRSLLASEPETELAPCDGVSMKRWIPSLGVESLRQLQSIAEAQMATFAKRTRVFSGVTNGNANLWPGSRVSVEGAPPGFEGTFTLTEVRHRLTANEGFLSYLNTLPLSPMPCHQSPVLLWGIVSQIDDPDNLGRIRVKLPACAGAETDWMQVLAAGAGISKGLMTLPDVGDHVCLLADADNFAHGVVLGSAFGPNRIPRSGIVHGSVQQHHWMTRKGQSVILDDAEGSLSVHNSGGSSVKLTQDGITIHSKGNLELSAPGHVLTLRGSAINLEQA